MEGKNIFVISFICIIIGMITLTLIINGSKVAIKIEPCSVMLKDLPSSEPLLLLQNNETNYLNAFVQPNSNGILSFAGASKINIACPGERNYIEINGVPTASHFEEAQCEHGSIFKLAGKSVNLYNITCSRKAQMHSARYNNETCGGSHTYDEIEIGFDIFGRFVKSLVVCYDKKLKNSLYSHQILSSSISGGRRDVKTSNFDEGRFYEGIKVSELYKQKTQIKTVNEILSFKENDTIYIKENITYLSKGHYSARADFAYGNQQMLTFYYVNVAPQWINFNSGNWKTMEEKCREYASNKKLDLDIYTGSHGISKLPNQIDALKELFLWKPSGTNSEGIPVPRLYYRVVYDQKSKAGVAFVGVNNPYIILAKEDVICQDVCDKIKWIGIPDMDRRNMTLGYFYCCQIDDLRKTVTAIPSEGLIVESLLT